MPRRVIDSAEKEMAFRAAWEGNAPIATIMREFNLSDRGVRRAAERMGLPPRQHENFLVRGDAREAFKQDWKIGIPLKELAAMYGFTNLNSVSRFAKQLGLPKRAGGPRSDRHSPGVLTGGQWVPNGRGIRVWKEAA